MESQAYLQQLNNIGQMPDFKSAIAQAYDAPVMRPLVEEGAQLESQWLPTIFDSFTKMGTGAADMSPAAKLAMIGGNLGRLGSRIGANSNMQNFYGMQVNDLANSENNKWMQNRSNLMDLYNLAFNREQADRQYQLAQQQLRASQQPQVNWDDIMNKFSTINNQPTPNTQASSPATFGIASDILNRINTIAGKAGANLPANIANTLNKTNNQLASAFQNAGYMTR